MTLIEMGRKEPWARRLAEKQPVAAHATLERTIYYVYILKLNDGTLYVGQTTCLAVRTMEHKDGLQRQTKEKTPSWSILNIVKVEETRWTREKKS